MKGSKKAFMLRMDAATYDALEKWAADEFRSVNGQLEWLLEQALKKAGRHHKNKTSPRNPPASSDSQT